MYQSKQWTYFGHTIYMDHDDGFYYIITPKGDKIEGFLTIDDALYYIDL